MKVCFKVRLEEDRTNVMGVLTTSTINSTAFSARSSNHDSDKNNRKPIPVCEQETMAHQGLVLETPRSTLMRLRLVCLLGIPFTSAGESVSEESNNTSEFIEPTPSIVSDIDPHPIILLTNQVPWKTYYRRNLRKEVGSPFSRSLAPVQDSEPPRDQEQKPVTMKLNKVIQGNLMSLIPLLTFPMLSEKMKALEKNRIWEICALPKGHKTVGCKWVFYLKYKANDTLDRHKARVLLSVAVNKDWSLCQLDVKNAFLNGDLMEEVYMSPCKDLRPNFIHYLRQVQGYSQGHSNHALFTKVSNIGKIVVLIVYVDDIVLTGDDQTEISQLKQRMGDEFKIKDLGNLKYFLRMEVAKSKECIFMSQKKCTLDLLTETGMLGCHPVDTPIEFNCKLGNSND
ncbi:Cysteine-rich RLK (receptor-like protein kinase) 8 [Cucumis melo var. makuwa]|uniref:Cysteine-rich RLK (Receptor-like protein kinase) 8 n=1 Tax=Cucumis melo var. makuwa TaxID=1194695 RepID=A0A5D3C5U5_CUCMM|nr:Cysteine-rich RLK (receptor-like protein kinase) 8 [Cucumis melo var. makuwa]